MVDFDNDYDDDDDDYDDFESDEEGCDHCNCYSEGEPCCECGERIDDL